MSHRLHKTDGRYRHGQETLVERERRARASAHIAIAADVLSLLGERIKKPSGRPSRYYKPVVDLDTAADQLLDHWLHMVPQDV
jgi:hypothetical protein